MKPYEVWHCPPAVCLTDRQRKLLIPWMLDHGISALLVGDACVTRGRGKNGLSCELLHVTVYATNSDGSRFLDLAANRPQTWPLTVPLVRAPPAEIPSWTGR